MHIKFLMENDHLEDQGVEGRIILEYFLISLNLQMRRIEDLNACMHACMHTYIHTYIHTYVTYIHTYIHKYINIRTC
jgi:hypothetical protein